MTDVLDIETITTLPIVPLEHPAFLDEVMEHAEPERIPFTRAGDPWWAVFIVILGALTAIGSGSFMITLQMFK